MIDYGYGVRLENVTNQDKENFFHWRNDYRIWKWCRQKGPLSYSQHNYYWDLVEGAQDKLFFAIRAKTKKMNDSFETLGCVGLTDIDHVNARAEFSCYIAPIYQKQGLGKHALRTLFNYAFKYLNLNSIWGETYDKNPAIDMFISLGMKVDGYRRAHYYRDGNFIDAHLISILKSEFKNELGSGSSSV
jgi:RimJ/RimL family protein N-acetyltransferase